jgi:hypothetical protein
MYYREAIRNFGVLPPAPTCTITANPTTINTQPPSNTSTLTTVVTGPPGYAGSYDYKWINGGTVNTGTFSTDGGLTFNATGSETTTSANPAVIWKAPSNYWNDGQTAQPQATVCIAGTTGSATCGTCQVGVGTPKISVVPLHSVSGFVYTDSNKDTHYNSGSETAYTNAKNIRLNVSICPFGSTHAGQTYDFCMGNAGFKSQIQTTAADGSFTTGATPSLTAGQYTVQLESVPDSSYSYSGGGPYQIEVGTPCGSTGSTTVCNQNGGGTWNSGTGNVTTVALGITNSNVWMQTTGGDVYMGGGIDYSVIPQSACGGSYMSVPNAPTIASPGVIYTGKTIGNLGETIGFGVGQASPYQNGVSSPWNWVVGQNNYPQPITTPVSITYSNRVAALGGDTSKFTPLPCTLAACNLTTANLDHGTYWASGDLYITAPSPLYTFPAGKNIEILVNGDLHIRTKLHVPQSSTVLFAVSGNIYVSGNVGEAVPTSTISDLEGFYSAKNFIVSNSVSDTNTVLSRCPAPDLRLNMQGAVVTTGGNFVIYRDMCSGDVCPTFTIQTRPDFIMNTPASYMHSSVIQQELAP